MANKPTADSQEEEIAERTAPPGEVVYLAIYDEGEHELQRTSVALGFSGLAAGLSMGLSFVSEALLRLHLPTGSWTELLTKLGYSIGFLVVILGRQQLFTKNTLTVILPLLKKWNLPLLGNVARLWAVVLVANLVGAFAFATLLARTPLFDEDVRSVLTEIASSVIQPSFWTILLRATLAGWLIALMVWLLPFAESARIWVIIIIAYLVGLAHLPHVIAGSVETFFLVVRGELSLAACLGSYLVPTLIGNVIGGVALVAIGAHAEFISSVAKENEPAR